jgi:hypothetical protein
MVAVAVTGSAGDLNHSRDYNCGLAIERIIPNVRREQ